MALKIFALLVGSVSVVYATTLWNECPLPEEMKSCSCRWLLAPVISCNQIKSQKDLQSNLEVFKGYGVHELTLTGIRTPSVSDNLFDGLYIRKLILDDFEVKEGPFALGSSPFLGLEKSLEEVEVKNSFNKDLSLSNLKLDHLKKLKIALFQDSRIPSISNECFADGPKTLKMLLLERNELKQLGDKAFQSLDNLMFIAVAGNRFSYVSRSMFPSPATHLYKMDLQDNRITILPTDMFSEMPSLSEINFSDNNIHVLLEGTWSDKLFNIARLYFDGNPLECDDKLKWVCSNRVDAVVAKCETPSERNGLTVRQFCKN